MGSLSSWPSSSTAFLCAWQHYSKLVPVWIATCSGWWFTDQRADFGEIIHQSSGWWITDQRVLLSSYPCGEVLVIFDSFATYMRTVECIISFRQESWISNFQHVEYYIEYFISSSKFMIWVSSFVWHFFFFFFFWWINLFLLLGIQGSQYRIGLASGMVYFGYRSIPVYRFGFIAILYI